jgi:hypothetical protein
MKIYPASLTKAELAKLRQMGDEQIKKGEYTEYSDIKQAMQHCKKILLKGRKKNGKVR